MASPLKFKKTYLNYYEKQRFNNIYILLALLIFEAIFVYASIVKLVAHKPFIFQSFKFWPLVIFTLLVPTTLLLAYLLIKLEVIINESGIFYRWKPFGKSYKMIQLDSIREISLIDLKHTGFFWRFTNKYDEVNYTDSGGVGFYILMRSGKKRIIGTKKAEEVNRVLSRVISNKYKPSDIGQYIDYSKE